MLADLPPILYLLLEFLICRRLLLNSFIFFFVFTIGIGHDKPLASNTIFAFTIFPPFLYIGAGVYK